MCIKSLTVIMTVISKCFIQTHMLLVIYLILKTGLFMFSREGIQRGGSNVHWYTLLMMLKVTYKDVMLLLDQVGLYICEHILIKVKLSDYCGSFCYYLFHSQSTYVEKCKVVNRWQVSLEKLLNLLIPIIWNPTYRFK